MAMLWSSAGRRTAITIAVIGFLSAFILIFFACYDPTYDDSVTRPSSVAIIGGAVIAVQSYSFIRTRDARKTLRTLIFWAVFSALILPFALTTVAVQLLPATVTLPSLMVTFWTCLSLLVVRWLSRKLSTAEITKVLKSSLIAFVTIAGMSAVFTPLAAARQLKTADAQILEAACDGSVLPITADASVVVRMLGVSDQRVSPDGSGSLNFKVPIYWHDITTTVYTKDLIADGGGFVAAPEDWSTRLFTTLGNMISLDILQLQDAKHMSMTFSTGDC